jgi:GNAT superfamily N-acetyltransferase
MLIRKARAGDAPAIARVHVDSWRTTYAGIVDSEFLAALSYKQREGTWNKVLSSPTSRSFIYVAEAADGQIIGFVCAGPEREGDEIHKGEIYALYLLHDYQRQGVGAMLLRASAQELLGRGITSVLVWVLAANPSRKFYEALGGRYLREKEMEIGNERFVEVAYGWPDIHCLAGK